MPKGPVVPHEDGVAIHVWVVPGASRTGIAGLYGDKLKVRVSAPAEAGKANRAVAGLLEERLGMDVELIKGMTSRHKVFHAPDIEERLASSKLGVLPGRW